MKAIFIKADAFDRNFQATLDKLQLIHYQEGTIDISLNSQADVDNFMTGLHRRFHYEVCMLKERLEK